MVGRTIAHYKIVDKLGEGGMGAVYRAEDQKLDRTVALKFVLSSISAGLDGHERLVREAKACAALNHPNITTVHDFGEDDSTSFIVMEYVEGVTLSDAIRQRSFRTEEVVAIGLQVADALGAAHEKGIIHRDLKSANIMLNASNRVKVMDFGLAKIAESSFVTQTGTTLGTAAYMSPEQVRGEELSPRSDIYSLGVVLYELAAGVTPYPHAHQLAVMYAVANEDPTPPREHNSAIPEALEAVILKAMSKRAEDRFASCEEFGEALRAVADPVSNGRAVRSAGSDAGVFRPVSGERDKPPIGEAAAVESERDRGVLRFDSRILQRRWFRVGVPVVLTAAVIAVVLVSQGPLLSGGLGGAPTQITAAAHVQTGFDLMRDGSFDEALREFTQAVEKDPNSSEAWRALAGASARLGDYEAAVRQSVRAIELDATNPEAHYNLGIGLEEIGRPDEALPAYAEAVRLDSSFTEANSALGNLLIEVGRPNEAVALLGRALDRTPDSEFAFLLRKNIGKAHLAMGNREDAVPHLIRSLDEAPDWPETTALLAQAYEASGQREEARELWRRYLQLETDPDKIAAVQERLAE